MLNFSHVRTAVLELTYKCQYKCKHCYIDQDIPISVDENRWMSLIDELYSLGCLTIILTGGEIFLNKDLLFSLLNKINYYKFNTILMTNGELIDNSDINLMKHYNVDKIIVSIYGYTSEIIKDVTSVYVEKPNVFRNILNMKEAGLNVEA